MNLDPLTQLPFAVWLRTSTWAYPGLETLHIIAIATLFGTLLIVELRLLGLLRQFEVRALALAVLPWSLAGFVLAAASGMLMFLSQAGELIGNRAFVLKMSLVFCAGLNAAWLHSRGPLDPTDRLTRAQALLSLFIWLTVILCGRMIAYL